MKTSSLAVVIALLATTVSSAAIAAVVYNPTADVSLSAATFQGLSVIAFSSVHNTNGTEVARSVDPGGSATSTVSGSRLSTVSGSATMNGGVGVTPLSSVAYGSASLERGELKASVTQVGPDVYGAPFGLVGATLADTLYFNNMSGGDLFLDIGYRFEGSILAPNGRGNGITNVSSLFQLAGGYCCGGIRYAADGLFADDSISAAFDKNDGFLGYNGGYPVPAHWVTGFFGDIGTSMSTRLVIPSGLSTLGLRANLSVRCGSGDTCDFGHTGTVRFGDLPSGLSYTSESGAFLTGLGGVVGGGVPEPATWAMMIAGFGLTGVALRRRRDLAAA